MRIALVEDNSDLKEEIAFQLEHLGHEVWAFSQGSAYLGWLQEDAGHDVLLLDLGLPDMDGLQIAETLRGLGQQIPVVMLTARDSLHDRVKGWEAGATVYLTKPIDLEELQAILGNLAQSEQTPAAPPGAALDLDMTRLRLSNVEGEAVDLSFNETNLLLYLRDAQPELASRADLIACVGDDPNDYDPRRLETMISRLRRKIACVSDANPTIKAARGKGYLLMLELAIVR